MLQGAPNTTDYVWTNRSGWHQLYNNSPSPSSSNSSSSSSANTVCSRLQQQQGSANSASPFFCDWFGIYCNASLFNSSCSSPAESAGISWIEMVNNNCSGSLSDAGFMRALQLLHDCGLRRLILGGGYGELRGQLGPEWGRLNKLQGLSIFTTNLSGTLPPEIGNLTGGLVGSGFWRRAIAGF